MRMIQDAINKLCIVVVVLVVVVVLAAAAAVICNIILQFNSSSTFQISFKTEVTVVYDLYTNLIISLV